MLSLHDELELTKKKQQRHCIYIEKDALTAVKVFEIRHNGANRI